MAVIKPERGHNVTVQIGDGATPTEVFATWCGNTQIAINYNINTETEDLPDCTDPLKVGFESPFKTSVGMSAEISGILSASFRSRLHEMALDADPMNVRIVFTGGTENGYWQGPAILSAAGSDYATQRGAGTYTGTITFTEEPVWTAVT